MVVHVDVDVVHIVVGDVVVVVVADLFRIVK